MNDTSGSTFDTRPISCDRRSFDAPPSVEDSINSSTKKNKKIITAAAKVPQVPPGGPEHKHHRSAFFVPCARWCFRCYAERAAPTNGPTRCRRTFHRLPPTSDRLESTRHWSMTCPSRCSSPWTLNTWATSPAPTSRRPDSKTTTSNPPEDTAMDWFFVDLMRCLGSMICTLQVNW